jgi:TIR domain
VAAPGNRPDQDDPRWDVFISYASKDRALAKKIEDDLVAAGFRVWRDGAVIRPGERLRERIEEGIRASAVVLIVLSARSLASRWVLNELDAAMLREIRERRDVVIPALIGRFPDEDVPVDLQGKLHLDFRHNFEKRYDELRPQLHAAIAAAGREEERELIVGDELMGRLIGHRFKGRERPDEVYLDAANHFAEIFARDDDASPDQIRARETFVSRYGALGLRQVFLYWMDVCRLDLAGFTMEELDEVLNGVQMLVMLFFVAERMAADGEGTLHVTLRGSEEPVFRFANERGRQSAADAGDAALQAT